MESKKLILSLCLLLVFCMLTPMAMAYDEPTTPEDNPIEPDPYTYIHSVDIYFDIASNGLTDDYCQVYIPNGNCTCNLYMHLQRWNDSTNQWETIKSWSTSGSDTITLEKEWYVASGYLYQLKCVMHVYNSGLLGEVATCYSEQIPFGYNP